MEQLVPDWLTTAFLTRCLQQKKEGIEVSNFTVSPAIPPGHNYGSIILRVKVEYKHNEGVDDNQVQYLSLIIKRELADGPAKDMIDTMDTQEYAFYSQFIPEVSKFIPPTFVPEAFLVPESSEIILEDLKEKGFVMADRIKQLDFEHCRLYVNAAATLHAVSIAVHKHNPKLLKSLGKEKMFSKELKSATFSENIIKTGMKCFADHTEKIDKFKKYSGLIRKTTLNLWNMLVDAHKPSEVLNTINQGDPWTTNMMFRYDEQGTVKEIKLLDFQALRYGSPVNDLVMFIWSSANHDVRGNRLDELYQIYLDALNTNLKNLNCTESLSYDSFMEHVKKLSPLALWLSGATLPSILYPEPLEFDNLIVQLNNECDAVDNSEKNPFDIHYDESFCNNHLPKLLEQLEATGVFEYLEQYNL